MATPLDSVKTSLAAAQDAYNTAAITMGTAKDAVEAAALAVSNYLPPDVRMQVATGIDTSGKTDVTVQLQACLDRGGMCYLPPGAYLVDPRLALQLRSGLYLVMHANALLLAKPNDLTRAYVLRGIAVFEGGVFGGHIIGDRMAHTYVAGSTSEWNHGVGLSQCGRYTVRDLMVEQCAGDGLSISGSDLEVSNVTSVGNRRQGMTIASGQRIKVLSGAYSKTGVYGANPGTKPMAGIDVEPDGGDVDDLLFDGVTFANNGTSDLLFWSRAGTGVDIRNARVQNCTMVGTPNGLEASGLGGKIDILATRNTLSAHKGASFKVGPGATMTIGTGDPADANTMASATARAAQTLTGIATKYDIQVAVGGTATVGVNRYTGPLPA